MWCYQCKKRDAKLVIRISNVFLLSTIYIVAIGKESLRDRVILHEDDLI